MSTTTSSLWQKYTSPEDIENDDASTTTTNINDSDDNDTDVPSQQSDSDTSGTTTRSMSLPRLSGPTIRLPPERPPSPSSSSSQSSLNEEKLKDKLRTRHDQHTFLTYLPENFFLVDHGDIKRFSELCSQCGWDDSYLIQLGSPLPNGLQTEMGAHVSTSQSSVNERKLQEELRTMELRLKSLNDSTFMGGDYNKCFLVDRSDMKRFGEFCDAQNDRDVFLSTWIGILRIHVDVYFVIAMM